LPFIVMPKDPESVSVTAHWFDRPGERDPAFAGLNLSQSTAGTCRSPFHPSNGQPRLQRVDL